MSGDEIPVTGRLAGEIAMVTGAGSGIGRATTLLFARAGAAVLAVDRSAEGMAATAEAAEREGLRLAPMVKDVSEDDAPALTLDRCQDLFGAPTVLFNNAGIGGSHAVDATDDAEFDRFVSVNLRAIFRMTRETLRLMLPLGRGAIINTTSVFGMSGFPGSSSYAATKSALIGLTYQLASDYGPRGIRVNAIAPGVIRTGMTARNIDHDPWYRDNMIATTPLAGPGAPEDIAYAALYLASREARFVNGHVLVVDGGWLTTHYRPRPDVG